MTEREKSDRREKEIARQEGGKRVPGSGSAPEHGGDIKFNGLLLEHKRTAQESMSVKVKDLIKVEFQAMNRARVPAFMIEFDNHGQSWAAFPMWWLRNQSWWKELKDAS